MIQITTPVACFQMNKTDVLSIANQVAMGQRYAIGNPSWRVEVYGFDGTVHFASGPVDIVPAVWSHTPFPWGMNPEAIQAKFEERAVSVLGDNVYTPDFTKYWNEDNRYMHINLREAWMMYVDLSIEHYNKAI